MLRAEPRTVASQSGFLKQPDKQELARYMLEKQCDLVGFDISAEAIAYCQQSYPQGTFFVADDATVVIPRHVYAGYDDKTDGPDRGYGDRVLAGFR